MKEKILNIYCPGCGSPANFDIVNQVYKCTSCGGKIEVEEAVEQKKGFRKLQQKIMTDSFKGFKLFSSTCEGCGATVVVEENEALSHCAFCGRNVVREKYLRYENMPECIIPFGVTDAEAKNLLGEWCDKNSSKAEAKAIKPLIKDLQGFYLPYEMVRGPIHANTGRSDDYSNHNWEGYINDEFINRSSQLDNMLLDGMEPFDTDALTGFDFSYVAGHKVKVPDLEEKRLEYRIAEEAEASFKPALSKLFGTNALDTLVQADSVVRMPALLPVYYINQDGHMAAVNGQTGKVSVRAEKESHFIFLPWWLKAILMTVLFGALLFGVLSLGSWSMGECLSIAGMVTAYFFIVLLVMYNDTYHNKFRVAKDREIYTSGEQTFKRVRGELIQNEDILKRKVSEPLFIKELDGVKTGVALRFKTPERMIKMFLLAGLIMFAPVILALFVNGFNFSQLELGGSAVWFCITVPTVPVILLKSGFVEIYENPWIYLIGEDGTLTRYKKKIEITGAKVWDTIKICLAALIVPPVCLITWAVIGSFGVMVYLTAFGF